MKDKFPTYPAPPEKYQWDKPLSKPIAVPKPESKKKKGRFDKEVKDEV